MSVPQMARLAPVYRQVAAVAPALSFLSVSVLGDLYLGILEKANA